MYDKVKLYCQYVENPGTTARLAIANDLPQFLRFTSQLEYVQKLIEEIKQHQKESPVQPTMAEFILAAKIGEMLTGDYDRQYANPKDDLITVYLYILQEVRSPYVVGLSAVTSTDKRLFWAAKFGREHIFI